MSDIEFKDWLMEQLDRDDPLGDLANNVKADKSAPIDSSTYDGWCFYIAPKFHIQYYLHSKWLGQNILEKYRFMVLEQIRKESGIS